MVGAERYAEAREAATQAARDMPDNSEALALAALLAWGVDRFDRASWETAEELAKQAYPADPLAVVGRAIDSSHPVGRIVRRHTEEHPLYREPLPTTRSLGMPNLSEIAAHNMAYPVPGFFTVDVGQTMRFGTDGKFVSLTNPDGAVCWRTSRLSGVGEVLFDGGGVPHIWTHRGVHALEEVRAERLKCVGW